MSCIHVCTIVIRISFFASLRSMTSLRYQEFIKLALKVIMLLSVGSSTAEARTKSVWSEALIVVWRPPPKEAPKNVWDPNGLSKVSPMLSSVTTVQCPRTLTKDAVSIKVVLSNR